MRLTTENLTKLVIPLVYMLNLMVPKINVDVPLKPMKVFENNLIVFNSVIVNLTTN